MKTNIRKGFTIVELVIVIAVIAILAAVLIPTFSGLTTRAKKNAAMQEAKNAYTAFLTEQGTAIQNHNLIIQQGDFFFAVKDGQLSDTPYETLDGAKALFDTVTSWSDKDEKGFYFPVTEPPVTEPPVTDDPLDSVDDPPPPVTPPEPDESWKEKFKESYADFWNGTDKVGEGDSSQYYAYLSLAFSHYDGENFYERTTTELLAALEIDSSRTLYRHIDPNNDYSDIVLLATQSELEAYAQTDYVYALYPYRYSSLISDPTKASTEIGTALYSVPSAEDTDAIKLDGQEHAIWIIDSIDELNRFSETYAASYTDYDEAYFQEKALLIAYVVAGSGSDRHGVPGVFVDGSSGTLLIDSVTPPMGTSDMAYWFLAVEIEPTTVTEWQVIIR